MLIRKFAAKIARRRLRSLIDLPQGPRRTPPGTQASSTISSTSTSAAASGTASSPRSTQRSCSRARSRAPPTSTPTRRTRPKSGVWPMRSTAGPTGTGRAMEARRSPTAGSPRPASCRTATRGTTRALALPSRPRLADSPTSAGESSRLLRHLPVEGNLRPRAALLRAAVHAPTFAPVGRFRGIRDAFMRDAPPTTSRQPAGDPRGAGVRRQGPRGFEGYGEHCWGIHCL